MAHYAKDINGEIKKNLEVKHLGDGIYVATSYLIDLNSGEKIEAQSVGSKSRVEKQIFVAMYGEMRQVKVVDSKVPERFKKRYGR